MLTPTEQPRLQGVRFPLSLKILLWFIVNLAFIAGVAMVFARGQLKLGLDSLLAGPVNDRLQSMSVILSRELNERPPKDWEPIIQSTSTAYHLPLALFRNDGSAAAGSMVLPKEVQDRLIELRDGRREGGPVA